MAKKTTKKSKTFKVEPLQDRVVIAPEKINQTKNNSSFFIPENNQKERPETGKVIAVGKGRILENGTQVKMSVKVGDLVIFSKYSPEEIKINDQDLIILKEDQILGIIK